MFVFRMISSLRTKCTTTEWQWLRERCIKQCRRDDFYQVYAENDVWQEYCDLTYHQVRNGCIWMPDNYVKDHVIIYTRILRHLIKTKTKVIANAISRNINLQNLRRASAFIDVMDRKVDRVILVQWKNFRLCYSMFTAGSSRLPRPLPRCARQEQDDPEQRHLQKVSQLTIWLTDSECIKSPISDKR